METRSRSPRVYHAIGDDGKTACGMLAVERRPFRGPGTRGVTSRRDADAYRAKACEKCFG